MKNIKFITTFSESGYQVYGKTWIDSFLDKTKDYPNITAKIYIDNLINIPELISNNKIDFVDYNIAIPQHAQWQTLYNYYGKHSDLNKKLAIKFSYKSFVMLDALKNINCDYIIWLDADCVFIDDNFINWPENILPDKFIACQKEKGSEHVESGILIFNCVHTEKYKFITCYENFYMNSSEFNAFGQLFDGFVVGRTILKQNISHVDLNDGYGLTGIQSDPSKTFLNPEINKRFYHNIGITGKKSYKNWDIYKNDKMFQLIFGVNDLSVSEKIEKDLKHVNNKLNYLVMRKNGKNT